MQKLCTAAWLEEGCVSNNLPDCFVFEQEGGGGGGGGAGAGAGGEKLEVPSSSNFVVFINFLSNHIVTFKNGIFLCSSFKILTNKQHCASGACMRLATSKLKSLLFGLRLPTVRVALLLEHQFGSKLKMLCLVPQMSLPKAAKSHTAPLPEQRLTQ